MAERRGMIIKNVTEALLTVRLRSRTFALESQEETVVTAEEVRDRTLRDHLQRRTLAVVRPATDEEVATIDA
ncbi:MAG: hypothetical protein AAF791_03175 [Bacteroidota bacterium]